MDTFEFIKQHRYNCYCEAVISPYGDIEYAIPSHLYKLMSVSGKTSEELYKLIPIDASPAHWLVEYTGYAAIWYDYFILPNHIYDKQDNALQALVDNDVLADNCRGIRTVEMSLTNIKSREFLSAEDLPKTTYLTICKRR